MASVFLSYDHEDAARAAPIAAALEQAGHSVWWDRQIHGGAEYNSEIEDAVTAADVVVVLWTERSIRSTWVRDEAAEGRDRGKLVPVVLDGTKPPMGFRQFQTIRLESRGRKRSPAIAELLHAIEKIAGSEPDNRPAVSAVSAHQGRSIPFWLTSGAVAITLIVLGMLWWRPWLSSPSAVVAVVAADPSRMSEDYSRALLAQLGQLQSARPNALQLVGSNARKTARLVFELAGAKEGQQVRANLVLLDSKSGSLLWSKSFERPAVETGDLQQELAYTAALLLNCANDAYGSEKAKLQMETLKLYLGGCADLAALPRPSEVIHIFRQVVRAEPMFEGAWTKLLLADMDALTDGPEDVEATKRLRQDIAAARKLHPNVAQAYLAEASLLPLNAFQQRIQLAERSAALAPDQSDPLLLRSEMLFSTGDVNSAVDEARRAAQMDPISPRVRQWYITVLADSGRTAAALKELNAAERLWPGATSQSFMRFRIHMRYGDPRIAMKMLRREAADIPAGWADAQSFLEARLNPTLENKRKALDDAERIYAREPDVFPHLIQALGEFGSVDELEAFLTNAHLDQAVNVVPYMFEPMFRRFWRDTRSLIYAKRVGLLQYWQSTGKWPDFCLERGLPYDCRKEAAKLLA